MNCSNPSSGESTALLSPLMPFVYQKKLWMKIALLIVVSPVLAIPSLFLVALIASMMLSMGSTGGWPESGLFLHSAGYAAFTSVLSIDSMLRAFYLTLPVLAVGAFTLLRTDFGFRRGSVRLLISLNCMGLLYVVVFHAGMYLGWLDEPFWT